MISTLLIGFPHWTLDHRSISMKDYSKRERIYFMWWTVVTTCVDIKCEIQRVMVIWNCTFCKGYKMHFTSQNISFSFSPVLLFHIETTLCAEIIARFPQSSQCRYWIQSSVVQAAHGESLWKSQNYFQIPNYPHFQRNQDLELSKHKRSHLNLKSYHTIKTTGECWIFQLFGQQNVHVKRKPGLPWHKQHSTWRRPFSPENRT